MSRVIRAEPQYAGIAFFAKTGGMRPSDIRERLQQSGRTQAALGKAIGKSKDSVSRLLNEQRGLSVLEAEAIRAFFDEGAPPAPSLQQVDVYGFAAAGGDDHISLATDDVIDQITLPAGLARGEVIAVRVAGDSMEPRLFSGETVIISKGVKPSKNGDCVVELRDGSAIIKQYQGQRDGFYFLRQFNPDKEVRVKATDVQAVHAVVLRR